MPFVVNRTRRMLSGFAVPQDLRVLCQRLAATIELPDAVVYGVAKYTHAIFEPALTPFTAALQQYAPEPLQMANDFTSKNIHTLSKKLPLMTPATVLFAIAFYFAALLILFLVGRVLPPLRMTLVSSLHNLFLTAVSFYMWAAIPITAVACGYTFFFNIRVGDSTPNDWRMAKLIWIFYVSKLPEFGDTFIMMLKQNYRQVSLLHLYHHITIFTIWFVVTMLAPGGDSYWSAMLNSGVHVVMYGYYFFTGIFPEGTFVRRMLNKVKFMITKGQMTQFVLNVVQSGYLKFVISPANLKALPLLVDILFYYMFTLLMLFGNFLMRNSGSRPSTSKVAAGKAKKSQ